MIKMSFFDKIEDVTIVDMFHSLTVRVKASCPKHSLLTSMPCLKQACVAPPNSQNELKQCELYLCHQYQEWHSTFIHSIQRLHDSEVSLSSYLFIVYY